MRNPSFYVLLLVLLVLDGWLLAHPNLIGRAGVFFFDYDYLNTFPKALGTVAAVVGVAFFVAWLAGQMGRIVGSILLIALLGVSAYWLYDSFLLYNSGVYKLTGAGFRAGAILMPGLLVLLFGKSFFDRIQTKTRRH
ncbi:MAG: hypothetical protein JWP57_3758 [Spirosoma sp.]|nr:hypothetical protein [Spirosoma sp.]